MKLSSFALMIRNWKSGELQLMFFAILVSVVCITSVVFFMRSLSLGLEDKSGALLGGDRALTSPNKISPHIIQKAKEFNLKTATTASFLSVIIHQGKWTLANVEGVSEHYPLRGELKIAKRFNNPGNETMDIPKSGSVWLEERLFTQLNMKPGDKITIGKAQFKADFLLTAEPARTLEGFDIAPRAIINEKDLEKTGVIITGVRANHKLLLAGNDSNIQKFSDWLTSQLNPSEAYVDSKTDRQLVKLAFERLDHYLGLAFIINVTLAGIAIAMVGRRFSQRQFDTVAILRCFGASNAWILRQYCLSFIVLGLLAGFIGISIGFIFERLMNQMFQDFFFYTPPTAVWVPIAGGLLTALVLLFGFALPPLMNLRKVPPLRVLRRDLLPPTISSMMIMFIALIAVSILLIFQTQDILLTLIFITTIVVISLFVLSIIYGLIKLLPKIGRFLSVSAQLIIRNIASRPKENAFQVLAFALVLTFGTTLFLVKNDLIQTWKNQIPANAPNYFAINITQNDLEKFKNFLQNAHIEKLQFFPMVQGRLMAVNEETVEMNSGSTKHRVLNRLLNLTWDDTLPADNRVVEGEWFTETNKNHKNNNNNSSNSHSSSNIKTNNHKNNGLVEISVEQKFAQLMKIKLNDILKFYINGKTVKTKVTSIREVNWDSFHPNFYIIFPSGVIEKENHSTQITQTTHTNKTYMTSFYVGPHQNEVLKNLIHQFPAITLVDAKMVMSEVKTFLGLFSWGVQYLWAFTLIASFVLLFATITATLDERQYEAVLLRVLGITNGRLFWVLLVEFLLLGLLAGIVAAISAHFIVYSLSKIIFGLAYGANPWVLISVPLMGMALVGLGGWIGTRRVFLTPPIQMFREV